MVTVVSTLSMHTNHMTDLTPAGADSRASWSVAGLNKVIGSIGVVDSMSAIVEASHSIHEFCDTRVSIAEWHSLPASVAAD